MASKILFAYDTPLPGWINNKPFTTQSTYKVLNPHKPSVVLREVYGSVAEGAGLAVQAAQAAFPAWKETPLTDRKAIFSRAIAILEERAAEWRSIAMWETTVSSSFADFEITILIGRLRELVNVSESALADQEVETGFPGQTATIVREPFGVILGIAPSNAPIALAARAVTEAILAGNTCVLKTSEVSPTGNMVISQIFAEAGLPAGVLNVVHASTKDTPSVVEALIGNPLVRKVNFTGSTRVGAIIASLAGKYLKPTVLELGGAAILLALEDADVEDAAKNAVFGGFLHSGQICMATNNVLVHESIADAFVAAVQKEMVNIKAGSSPDPARNAIRGVFSPIHAQNITRLVEDAVSKGASVVVGDEANAGKYDGSNVVQPYVLDGVKPNMVIYKEEIFGPVFGIIRFKTEEEAVGIWNSLDYGLAGAIHSKDITRAKKLARKLETNLININSFTIHDNPNIPHGGWKRSGYGRFNGVEGLKEFTQTKSISVADPGSTVPSL